MRRYEARRDAAGGPRWRALPRQAAPIFVRWGRPSISATGTRELARDPLLSLAERRARSSRTCCQARTRSGAVAIGGQACEFGQEIEVAAGSRAPGLVLAAGRQGPRFAERPARQGASVHEMRGCGHGTTLPHGRSLPPPEARRWLNRRGFSPSPHRSALESPPTSGRCANQDGFPAPVRREDVKRREPSRGDRSGRL